MPKKYDFSGWATKFNLKCSDGRVIAKDAFKDCDGKIVPLVWMHQHGGPENVLGHALLEYRPEGMYAYGSFNDTEEGSRAKHLVSHGDIRSLSIFANQLVQKGCDVLHGIIREVSLVYAGANPGASIENPVLMHSDEEDITSAVIYSGEEYDLYLSHSDEEKEAKMGGDEGKTLQEVYDTLNDEQKDLVHALVGMAIDGDDGDDEDADQTVKHSAKDEDEEDLEDEENLDEEDPENLDNVDEDEEEKQMKHNAFDALNDRGAVLSHAEMRNFATAVFSDLKKYGSFKDSFMAHADTYGIKDKTINGVTYTIEDLFPEFRNLTKEPAWIKRDTEWVGKVMNGVHRTPFSRIKTMFADITEDDARAKGYFKGKLKKEEVFTLLKRTTDPQTIYKKQKLDRDDIIDITDFDVVAWIRREMRMMLEEEIARAILIGDGRLPSSDDKIKEQHVRAIMNDEELFNIQVEVEKGADEEETSKNIIRSIIKARKNYKGSGQPTLYINEDYLVDMLLIEDGIGHYLYETEATLATKLRVKEIVPVPVMENVNVKVGANENPLVGIIVNLTDYNVGADRGGEVAMFDDFDIDYNQQKYLIETRISGALTVPYSAMTVSVKP